MGNSLSGRRPDIFDPEHHKINPDVSNAVYTNQNPDLPIPMANETQTVYEKSLEVATNIPDKENSNQFTEQSKIDKYARFRTEMFSYMLGESAYDYAEKLLQKHPDDPLLMAFLAETIQLYEKRKIIQKRIHWIDRLDILQRGVDVTRQCIEKNPEFIPCYKQYVLLATKMADHLYHLRWKHSLGNIENYEGLMKRGMQALEMLDYQDFDLATTLASLNGRCATEWYSPYRFYGLYYGVPDKKTLLERSLFFHQIANKVNSSHIENTVRTAGVLFDLGRVTESRKVYVRARDALAPHDSNDESWQGVAHTHLCLRFQKSRWNIPV